MLKRLTRKLVTLSVLCAALAAVSSAPASSANRRIVICYPAPVDFCESGYYCCHDDGSCKCG